MTIYVGNISYTVTRKDLEELFGHYGHVIKVSMPKDHEKGRLKGYAFIDFEEGVNEDKIVEELNNSQHLGRTLKVEKAQSKRNEPF